MSTKKFMAYEIIVIFFQFQEKICDIVAEFPWDEIIFVSIKA